MIVVLGVWNRYFGAISPVLITFIFFTEPVSVRNLS